MGGFWVFEQYIRPSNVNGNFEKNLRSNFEIDLRPLKFSPKNLRPLILLSENLRPLKKHSGRVFPINNVHPLIRVCGNIFMCLWE